MAFKTSLDIAWAVCLRTWKKTARRPVVLVFSLAQPLMWMLFFGFLFQRYTVDSVSETPYLQFLMPGICVMTILFGASQSGTALVRDMQTGFLGRMLQTSAPATAILGGKLLADVIRLLVQAALVCLLGIALGARIHPHASSLLMAGAYLALFALAYSCLSCWIALMTRSQEAMGVFIQAINMPVLFTSTALVPSHHMPPWLAHLAKWNPLSFAADTARAALLRGQFQTPATSILVTGAEAGLLLALSLSALNRHQKI